MRTAASYQSAIKGEELNEWYVANISFMDDGLISTAISGKSSHKGMENVRSKMSKRRIFSLRDGMPVDGCRGLPNNPRCGISRKPAQFPIRE